MYFLFYFDSIFSFAHILSSFLLVWLASCPDFFHIFLVPLLSVSVLSSLCCVLLPVLFWLFVIILGLRKLLFFFSFTSDLGVVVTLTWRELNETCVNVFVCVYCTYWGSFCIILLMEKSMQTKPSVFRLAFDWFWRSTEQLCYATDLLRLVAIVYTHTHTHSFYWSWQSYMSKNCTRARELQCIFFIFLQKRGKIRPIQPSSPMCDYEILQGWNDA